MSAWPERPDDFVQWASRRHGAVRPGAMHEVARREVLPLWMGPRADRVLPVLRVDLVDAAALPMAS